MAGLKAIYDVEQTRKRREQYGPGILCPQLPIRGQ
jgi:hypothetical protein